MTRPTVTATIELPTTAAALWSILGDADGLAGWLANAPADPGPDSDPGPGGGPLVAGAALDLPVDATVRRLVVTGVEADRRVGFTWWDLDDPDRVSQVELAIEATDAGVAVTVTETLDPTAAAGRAGGRSAGLAEASVEADALVARWDARLDALLGCPAGRLGALV